MHVDCLAKIYDRKTTIPNMTIKDGTLAKSCRDPDDVCNNISGFFPTIKLL